MNRLLHVLLMALALLLVAGCEKGPTPKEGDPSKAAAPKVGTTETGGAHPAPGMADPHAGMAPSTGPQGAGAAAGQPDASGMIDVGAIAFKVPPKWQAQQPKSGMRRAQVSAPGKAGPAELIVFFFGPQGAGTTQANIDRWVGQFTNPDGTVVNDAKQTSGKVAGFGVTRLEVAGRYASDMGAPGQEQAPSPDQRLIAAIVHADDGPYYFKFLGPNATVMENGTAFDELLASIVASP